MFAFAFYCFHTKLLKVLDDEELLRSVVVRGSGVLPDESAASKVSLGEDTAMVARISDRVAADYGFVVQYGLGKTEAIMVLRGHLKSEAIRIIQQSEVGEDLNRQPVLEIGQGKSLRIVKGYKHLGVVANASLRFGAAVSARTIEGVII